MLRNFICKRRVNCIMRNTTRLRLGNRRDEHAPTIQTHFLRLYSAIYKFTKMEVQKAARQHTFIFIKPARLVVANIFIIFIADRNFHFRLYQNMEIATKSKSLLSLQLFQKFLNSVMYFDKNKLIPATPVLLKKQINDCALVDSCANIYI